MTLTWNDVTPKTFVDGASNSQDAHAREMSSEALEIVRVGREHDITARRRRCHDDGVDGCRPPHGCERFTSPACKSLRKRFDVDQLEQVFTAIASSSPPFEHDGRRHDGDNPPFSRSKEKLLRSSPTSLERDQHPRVERQALPHDDLALRRRAGAFRGRFGGTASPESSASSRARASSVRGATRYFSK